VGGEAGAPDAFVEALDDAALAWAERGAALELPEAPTRPEGRAPAVASLDLRHLHAAWNRRPPLGQARPAGRGPRAVARWILGRLLERLFAEQFAYEQDFRGALTRTCQELAERLDAIEREHASLVELMRRNLARIELRLATDKPRQLHEGS
jgi:hypothetical protein